MPVPIPSYRAEEQNAQALALLGRQGARQREQTRYATEDMARTKREVGGAYGKAISSAVDNYVKGSDRAYSNEEAQGRIDEQRRKKKLSDEEDKFMSEEVSPGLTRREVAIQQKLDADKADLDYKKSQIAKNEFDMKQGGVKPETASDRKVRIETAANLFSGGVTPEALANAKAMGLNAAEIAAAQGVAGAAQAKLAKDQELKLPEREGLAATKEAARAAKEAELLFAGGYDAIPKSKKFTTSGFGQVLDLDTEEDKRYKNIQNAYVKAIFNQRGDRQPKEADIEFERGTYFPQPGDTPEDVAAKNLRRAEKTKELFGVYGDNSYQAQLDQEYATRIADATAKAKGNKALGGQGAAVAGPVGGSQGMPVGAPPQNIRPMDPAQVNTPVAPPQAKTVTQNGYTYTWNPQTKRYE